MWVYRRLDTKPTAGPRSGRGAGAASPGDPGTLAGRRSDGVPVLSGGGRDGPSRRTPSQPQDADDAEQPGAEAEEEPQAGASSLLHPLRLRDGDPPGLQGGRDPGLGTNRLRHSAATKFRKHGGIEAARQILGHAAASVTEVYAEADLGQVVAIMARIG